MLSSGDLPLLHPSHCASLVGPSNVPEGGHGEGEGSAVDKFRVSGTQETVEGAGANEVSGVLSEASCCRCGAPLIKKKRPTLFSRPPSVISEYHAVRCDRRTGVFICISAFVCHTCKFYTKVETKFHIPKKLCISYTT